MASRGVVPALLLLLSMHGTCPASTHLCRFSAPCSISLARLSVARIHIPTPISSRLHGHRLHNFRARANVHSFPPSEQTQSICRIRTLHPPRTTAANIYIPPSRLLPIRLLPFVKLPTRPPRRKPGALTCPGRAGSRPTNRARKNKRI